jgi:hypothetical protein
MHMLFRGIPFVMVLMLAVLAVSGCASVTQPDTGDQAGTEGEARVYVPAKTPREAFEAYRRAIDEGDFEGFKMSVPAQIVSTMEEQMPKGMTEDNFRQVFSMMKAFMVPADDLVIEEEERGSDWTNWTVRDRNDPESTGTISFIKEADGWKVLKEQWKSGL